MLCSMCALGTRDPLWKCPHCGAESCRHIGRLDHYRAQPPYGHGYLTREEVVKAMAERGLTRVVTLGSPEGTPAEDWDPYGRRSDTDWQLRNAVQSSRQPTLPWFGTIDGDEAVDGFDTTGQTEDDRKRYRWKFLP